MKITIEKRAVATEEVDIDFPLFIESGDVLDTEGGWETIFRIESSGEFFVLTRRFENSSEPSEFEFERGYMDLKTDLASYMSGRSVVQERRFSNLLAAFRAELSNFPGGQ